MIKWQDENAITREKVIAEFLRLWCDLDIDISYEIVGADTKEQSVTVKFFYDDLSEDGEEFVGVPQFYHI
jgi:hypothetical protein